MNSELGSKRPKKAPELPRAKVQRTFGEPRFHTDSELAALAYSPDGQLWSIEEAGWLRGWGHDGRQLKQTFLSDLETLWLFSPDASWLASAADDLSLWDAATGTQLATIQQPSWVTAAVFSSDKSLIATGHDDGRVRLWNCESQALVAELHEHQAPVSALAFSPDGSKLAIAGEDRLIQIVDVKTGLRHKTLTGHTDRIPALAWHAGGTLLVSAGWDTTARLWDTNTGDPLLLLNSHADQVLALAFSRDDSLLAVADSDNVIHVWDDPRTGKTRHMLTGHADEIRFLTFSPDGTRLASAGNDRAVHVWDPRAGLLLAGQNARTKHAISVCGGTQPRLATSCGGTALEVWDLATGQTVPPSGAVVPQIEAGKPEPDEPATRKMAPLRPTGVALSPDGRWLIAGGTDSYVHLWDNGAGPTQIRGHWGPVGTLAFAPDNTLFASACASDGTCWVWNAESKEPFLLITEAADGCSVEAVAFHPNSRWLACGGIDGLATRGTDGAIGVWDIVERSRIYILEGGVFSLAFHPNGRWLAGATLGETVIVWDVTDGDAAPFRLVGHLERVRAVAFSPNGRYLVTAGDDRTLRLWHGEIFAQAGVWQLEHAVKALAFSADGQLLFISNANTTCSQIEWKSLVAH
ncbi:MAG: WD40 repeat domain-containing protein [Gemmataceae bacterium]